MKKVVKPDKAQSLVTRSQKVDLLTNLRRAPAYICGIPLLALFTLGIRTRIGINSLLKKEKPNFDGLCGRFFSKVGPIARKSMGVNVELHGDIPKIDKENERAIIMTNHPTTDMLWVFLETITNEITQDIIAVGKEEMLTDWKNLSPIFGESMDQAEKYIALKRNDRKNDIKSISSGAQYAKPGSGTLIMLDGTRPKPSSIKYAQKKLSEIERGDLADDWNYTGFPKSGGLLALIEAFDQMDNCRTRIIDLLVASDQPNHQPCGSTLHIFGQELKKEDIIGETDDPAMQRDHANRFLLNLYHKGNLKINELRGS